MKEDKLWAVLALILTVVLCFILQSCKTVKTVVEYRDREIVKTELQHDSIYMHDSVYVVSRNDTVYRDRWHTEYAYKYINRVDSFVQIDSIPYPVEVEKVVTKNSPMAKAALWWMWISIAIAALVIGWKLYKR